MSDIPPKERLFLAIVAVVVSIILSLVASQ